MPRDTQNCAHSAPQAIRNAEKMTDGNGQREARIEAFGATEGGTAEAAAAARASALRPRAVARGRGFFIGRRS
jgi:hypothetical protein